MKKIALIASFSLIGILIVLTIVAGFVKKSFLPEFAEANSISYCFDNGASVQSVNPDETEYTELYSAFKGAFQKSFLTAMFDGSNKTGIEGEDIQSTTVSQTGTYIRLNYVEDQTLTINGEIYKHQSSGVIVKYDKVWLTVTNSSTYSTVKMYLTLDASTRSTCYVTTIAKTDDLYSIIQELYERTTELEEE
ncbi:MAG: hypothetical protein WCR30_03115 [Clostridia bacterium]